MVIVGLVLVDFALFSTTINTNAFGESNRTELLPKYCGK